MERVWLTARSLFRFLGGRHLWSKVMSAIIGGILLIMIANYRRIFVHHEERHFRQYFISQSRNEVAVDNWTYVIQNRMKCKRNASAFDKVHLLLVVKSVPNHTDRRRAIRLTWGWEYRFPGVKIRCVFILGFNREDDSESQELIQSEQEEHGDMIQGLFVDNKDNAILKTMMGLRWVVENCPDAQFIMFVSDDTYVSVKNVFNYVKYRHKYPFGITEKASARKMPYQIRNSDIKAYNNTDDFYAGCVIRGLPVQRDPNDRWYIPKSEYPFDEYPPFVAAGAVIVSFPTLAKLYATCFFVKRIRLDDVYLGVVAKMAGIAPQHSDQVHNDKQPYRLRFTYQVAISSPGYENPDELINVWSMQYRLGFA